MKRFDSSLSIGKTGEEIYHKLNPGLKREDGILFDFSTNEGESIEVKTDSYDMDKTENFYMERFSCNGKDGGPWQSRNNNVGYLLGNRRRNNRK